MNQNKLNSSLTGQAGLTASIQGTVHANNGGSQVYLPQKYKKGQHGPGGLKQAGHALNASKKGVRQLGNNSASILLNQSYDMAKSNLAKLQMQHSTYGNTKALIGGAAGGSAGGKSESQQLGHLGHGNSMKAAAHAKQILNIYSNPGQENYQKKLQQKN